MKSKISLTAPLLSVLCFFVLFLFSNGFMGGTILAKLYIAIIVFFVLLAAGIFMGKYEKASAKSLTLFYITAGLVPYILFFILETAIGAAYPEIPQDTTARETYYTLLTMKESAAGTAKTVLPWIFVIYSVIFSKKLTFLQSASAISLAAISQRLILIIFGLLSIFPSGVSYLDVEWFGSSLSLLGAVAAVLFMYIFQKGKIK